MNKIELLFLGNAASAVAAAKETEGAVAGVGTEAKATTGHMKLLGIGAIAVLGGLAEGLKKSVDAAEEMQVSTARMNASFAAVHVPVKAFAGAIDEAEASARKLGFENLDVRDSLGSLVIATHNGKKAIDDLAVAEDIARFKHIDLASASKVLTMAMAGSQRATKQLGITVPSVTTAYDTLKATMGKTIDAHEKLLLAQAKVQDKMATANAVIATVTEKLHGQADAYSQTAQGGMEAFHAQLNNLEESLGTLLLPAITAAAGALATFASYLTTTVVPAIQTMVAWVHDHWPEIMATIGPTMIQIRTIIEAVLTDVDAFWQRYGSTVLTVLKDVGVVIKDALTVIEDLFKVLGDLLRGDWSQLWTDLKKTAVDELNLLLQELKDLGALFEAAMVALGKLALKGLEAGLNGLADLVKGAVNAGITAIVDLGKSALTTGEQFGVSLIKGIGNGLAGFAKELEELLVAPLNAVISAWDHISFNVHVPGVNTHIPGVGTIGGFDFGFQVPQIPLLAAGGIVTSPTLAMIGEAGPEAVVPLDRFGGMGLTISFAGANIYGAPSRATLDSWANGIASALDRLGPGMAIAR